MSSEPEDLLENAFFLTLKARYPRLYHLAEEKGFAICVPQDSIARALRITDEVAGMHGEVWPCLCMITRPTKSVSMRLGWVGLDWIGLDWIG
jgi:hypothetical protein